MKIGAQMYTVNKHVNTLEGIDASFKKVKEIGYDIVQLSGMCEFDPNWMKDELAKYDLKAVITHIAPQKMMEDVDKVIADHKIFGCTHIGMGGMPVDMRGSIEGYEKYRDTFVPIAKRMQEQGATLMYHNHWFEFDDIYGKNLLERMAEDFPEGSIGFTLDCGWAAYAGQDVVELIGKLSGKLSCIHLKDFADKPEDGSITTQAYLRPIFEGKLDYDAYLKALEAAGTEYAIVEQDWCYGEDEFECLRRSFVNVTSRYPAMK